MDFIFYFFIFVFGLIIGSFLNCVIYRLETGGNFLKGSPRRKASFLWGRSFCPHCKHILRWYDLIPVFSFIILKRKCRYCGEKISWQYPLVETATGLLFLLILNFSAQNGPALGWQFLFSIFYFLIISCFLIIIFVYDLKYFIIPDRVIFPAIAVALIYNFLPLKAGFNQFSVFNYSILSAIGASLFFLIIFLISRGKWMGFGDVKLAFLMGLFLSFPNILVALFSAFFLGAIIGIGLIMAKKKKFKSEVPFGPFLITGTFIALFYGEKIIIWYLKAFLI